MHLHLLQLLKLLQAQPALLLLQPALLPMQPRPLQVLLKPLLLLLLPLLLTLLKLPVLLQLLLPTLQKLLLQPQPHRSNSLPVIKKPAFESAFFIAALFVTGVIDQLRVTKQATLIKQLSMHLDPAEAIGLTCDANLCHRRTKASHNRCMRQLRCVILLA